MIRRYVSCPECARRFDLCDETDAEEWAYGHDCEAPEHPAPVSRVDRGTLSRILRESAERTGQGPIVAQDSGRES